MQTLRRLKAMNARSRSRRRRRCGRYIERALRSPREDYREYTDALVRYNCGFAADLHNSTTPAQRQVALERLKGWERDVRALAADASIK